MNQSKMSLVFDGPAVENGEIEAQDLASALMAVGELIQAANQEINSDRAQMSVKVRAISSGSFEVDLTLFQSLMESAKALLEFARDNKDDIATTSDLLDLLVNVGTIAGAIGLFELIRRLRGKKPEKVKEKGGDTHIHIDGNLIVVKKQVVRLFNNAAVREQAKKVVAPLSNEGIDAIKIKRPNQPDLEIVKEDVPSFEYGDGEELLDEKTHEMTLQIISLSFKEDNKWRVTDGGEPFNVAIEDAEFLNKIGKNEVAFSKGDYFLCLIRERQYDTAKGLKKERSIVEVKDHKSAARQLHLVV